MTMKVFDTHTHVFPDKIAVQALAHLREKSKGIPAFTLGTFNDLAIHAKEAGYSGWMNCPVVTRPNQSKSVNAWVASHNHWPSLSLGGVHPEDEDVCDVIHHLHELGLHGVKFHPEYQEFGVLEKRVEPIWSLCEELGLPVLIHGGNDIGFEPPFHSRPADYVELSHRHPGLTIIAAHMGGWLVWDEVERDLIGSDVLIDTSFSMPYMKDRSQFLRMVKNHGAKKVLFGTDSPWQDLAEAINDVKTSGLSEEELEDVFWNNAAGVWKSAVEFQQ